MDKDVKRALILWPAVASTAIVAATTLPCLWDVDSQAEHLRQVANSMFDSEGLSTRRLAESLNLATAMPRPDRGLRGMALPQRLVRIDADRMVSTAGIDGGDGECAGSSSRATSESARMAASSQPMAGTLLAPVLDPVAELAGYSGSVSPSIVGPAGKVPFTATGRTLSSAWKSSLTPLASLHEMELQSAGATPNQGSQSLIPRSVQVLAKPSRSPRESDTRSRVLNTSLVVNVGNPVTWPRPKQLCQDLDFIISGTDATRVLRKGDQAARLISSSPPASPGSLEIGESSMHRHATSLVMGRWADKVQRTLDELRRLPRIGDERSGEIIRQLAALSEAGLQLAERVPARDQQVRWLRASHALSRRAAVWGPIWQLARQSDGVSPPSAGQDVTSVPKGTSVPGANLMGPGSEYSLVQFQTQPPDMETHVGHLVEGLRDELAETEDVTGWTAFLLLDEIEEASHKGSTHSRALLGQRFLSRLDHHSLLGSHREWLRRDSVWGLASVMQTWTAQPIDYSRLLGDLERGETNSIDLAAIKVSEAFQSLRFSDDIDAARVAKAIDVTYRNANVRTAISLEMIQRLLPPVAPKTAPIRTSLLGNEVRGTSTVQSQLGLRLQPSPDSWNLAITTDGNVATRSRSGRSGVTVLSKGTNTFSATTPLIIRPEGYRIGATEVDVSGRQRLSGVRSRYDRWPLIGGLVRGIAEAKFVQAQPIAQQVSRHRIRSEVTEELQTQLSEKSLDAELHMEKFVFGPLGQLELDPKVIDLETTPQRLVARYRLAGDWQLASNTPRPRAWSDSWMSLQVHQSAFNNTMERLLPTGQSKSIRQFYTDTVELFGRDAEELPADIPGDAMVEFAGTRPVTIEIDEGKMWLTVRVVKLAQPDGPSLRKFIVRAAYRAEIDGLQAKLVRDGHLSISGPGMSMRQRIPLRALFNKILSEQRSIPLTMPRLVEHPATQGLAISQVEMRDGWLAIAISPATSPRVAQGGPSAVSR